MIWLKLMEFVVMEDPNFLFLKEEYLTLYDYCRDVDYFIYLNKYSASMHTARVAIEHLLKKYINHGRLLGDELSLKELINRVQNKINGNILKDLEIIRDYGNKTSHDNLYKGNKKDADYIAGKLHDVVKDFFNEKTYDMPFKKDYEPIRGDEEWLVSINKLDLDDELKEKYGSEITNLQDDVEDIKQNLENIEKENTRLKNELNNLKKVLTELNQPNLEIQEIKRKLSDMENNDDVSNLKSDLGEIKEKITEMRTNYHDKYNFEIDELKKQICNIELNTDNDELEEKLKSVISTMSILKSRINNYDLIDVDNLIKNINELKSGFEYSVTQDQLNEVINKLKDLENSVNNDDITTILNNVNLMDEFNNESPEQKKAITSKSPKLIIDAGPGSGKTRVLVKRVKYLLENTPNIDPKSFLIITFSEKAANQLKERLIEMNIPPEDINEMQISTIHGFCSTILRDYYSSGVEIVDDHYNNHKTLFIRKHREELGFTAYDYIPENELNIVADRFDDYARFHVNMPDFIEYIKDRYFKKRMLKKDDEYKEFIDKKREELKEDYIFPEEEVRENKILNKRWYCHKYLAIANAYLKYIDILEKEKAYDFNYLQYKANEFLKEDDNLNKIIYKNIFIDEFQDTDVVQLEIFKSLMKIADTFTIVGDPNQSIYGWRGSTPAFFREFWMDKRFEKVRLETNFRSKKNIVEFNENYFKKYDSSKRNLTPYKLENGDIYYLNNKNKADQAVKIVKTIKYLKNSNKIRNYSDIAILCRSTNEYNIGELLNELYRNDIDYNIKGLNDLSNKKEVNGFVTLIWYLTKEMLPYAKNSNENNVDLNIINNEFGLDLFTDAEINNEVFKLSQGTIDVINTYKGTPQEFSLMEEDQLQELGIDDSRDLEFFTQLNDLKREYHSYENDEEKGLNLLEVYYKLFKITGYVDNKFNNNQEYRKHPELLNLALISQIIDEFMDIVDRFDIDEFFNFLINNYERYSSPENELADANKVQIMTIHKAKGLEFPVVFLCSLDYYFPKVYKSREKDQDYNNPTYPTLPKFYKRFVDVKDAKNIDRKEHNEEEYRLIYVAITRAMDTLFISHIDNKKSNELATMKVVNHSFEEMTEDKLNSLQKVYSYINEENDVIDISFTSMQNYKICPHKYDLIHNYEFVTPQNVSMYIGSVVHSVLDKIHREAMDIYNNQNIDKDEHMDKFIHDKIEEAIKSNTSLSDIPEFENSLDKIDEWWDEHSDDEILASELPFTITEKGYNLVGKMDLIIKNKNNDDELNIIDFKTSSSDNFEMNIDDHKNQLHLYSLALRYNSHYSGVNSLNYIYSVNDAELNEVYVDKDKLTELENETKEISTQILENKFQKDKFDENNVKKCESCLLKDLCCEE